MNPKCPACDLELDIDEEIGYFRCRHCGYRRPID
jgi:DNA-directed RNA polymerase subunit RPC12/RpoP